jgi:hypothetical protein
MPGHAAKQSTSTHQLATHTSARFLRVETHE